MSDTLEKFSKTINKKKPAGWSAGYGTDVDIDIDPDIAQVVTEALYSEKKTKDAVWYFIQMIIAIMDYRETQSPEDMRKAKLYGEHLLGRLLK